MAGFVSITALAWMFFVEGNFGINYQFWQAIIFNRTSSTRFGLTFGYLPFFLFCFLIPGIAMNTTRRLKDTGNPGKDLARDMAINFAIGFIPVFVLLCIQYLPSLILQSGFTTWNRATYSFLGARNSVAALDYAWNIPTINGVMAAINVFFYRKTGTVWLGVILAAIFTTIVVCSNYTLAL